MKKQLLLFALALIVGLGIFILLYNDILFSYSTSEDDLISAISEEEVKSIDISINSKYIYYNKFNDKKDYRTLVEKRERRDEIYDIAKEDDSILVSRTTRKDSNLISVLIPSVLCFLFVYVFYYNVIRVNQYKKAKRDFYVKMTSASEKVEEDKEGEVETTTFADVIGLDNQIEELMDIVDFLRFPEKYKNMGATIPKGILFYGKPGTGKTLIARAIAGEANCTFIQLSASEIQNKYLGESEANIRRLFDKAEREAPAIIFLDEIDSIAQERYSTFGNRYSASILNQLLACMDGFESSRGVIVIAATNHKDVLDDAILRTGRFDRQIYIREPDRKAREKLIEYYMQGKTFDEDCEAKKLSMITAGFTGSDIKILLNEAAILAVRRDSEKISMNDIYEAFRKMTIGIRDNDIEKNLKERKITAVHEAGHAVVSRILGRTPMEISIIPRGDAGGYNLYNIDDKSLYSITDIFNNVKTSLGGRAAEKVIFGEFYSGASADLKNATQLLNTMHLVYGMDPDDEVQLVVCENNEHNKNAVMRNYDAETTELKRCYAETLDIVKKNKAIIQKLADILFDKEIMENGEIEAFFRENKI